MRLLLDTNRYRDFCAGETGVARAVRRAEQVFRQLREQGTPIPANANDNDNDNERIETPSPH